MTVALRSTGNCLASSRVVVPPSKMIVWPSYSVSMAARAMAVLSAAEILARSFSPDMAGAAGSAPPWTRVSRP